MIISYRDSKRYPSDPLALKAWVRVADVMARQVVCPRPFDPLQFARALEVCRSLTCRKGSEAIRRLIAVCATAGVAVVVVPAIEDCHLSSASQWLGGGGNTREMRGHARGMIALSLRYRRDDQLYFSFFREAGAILAAEKGTKAFDPDAFAAAFLIPREYQPRLTAIAAIGEAETMSGMIKELAGELGIAPGLVVGRLQHDSLIPYSHQNRLKQEVDLSYVLEASEAAEETWPDQAAATTLVMKDFGLDADAARKRVQRAVLGGAVLTNGKTHKRCRIEPGQLAAWRLLMRGRDLDAEEHDEAA